MSDYVVSVIRTSVPALWGAVVAWLVGARLLPPELAANAEAFAVVLSAVGVAGFYALARWLEGQTWFPVWLARVLLGSGKAPSYEPPRHAA